MMQERRNIYQWFLIAWILLLGCVVSPAQANGYPQAEAPTYQFRSTSNCPSMVGNSRYRSTVSAPFVASPTISSPAGGPHKAKKEDDTSGWDLDGDETTDPTGEGIGQVNTPVGDGLWALLLMVAAYAWIVKKRKWCHEKDYRI